MTHQSKTLRILFIGAIVFLIVLSFLTYRRLTSLNALGQLVNRTTQQPTIIFLVSLLALIILSISYWQLSKSINRSGDLQEVMIRQNVQLQKKKELQNIFDQAPVPLVVFRGRDFIIEIINDVALALLGQTRSTVMDKSLFEIAPQLQPIMYPILTQIMDTGKPFKAEEFPLQFIHDGQPYNGYFDFICQPAIDETGKLTGIIAIGAEVTESVMARKQIQRSEERYRELSLSLEEKVVTRTSELKKEKEFSETIIDATVDMIGVYDTEMRILVLNKACENFFKINREEVIGKVYSEVFPGSLGTNGHRDLLLALKGETIHNKLYHSSVTHRYYENFLSPLRDDQGMIYAALVIAHDITDTVESSEKINNANSALQEHNQFIETLLNSSPDRIIVIDKNFRFISVNKKAQIDFNDREVDLLNGKTGTEIYPPDEAARINAGVTRALGGEAVISDKTKSTFSDQYFKHHYIPLKNLTQEVYAVMIISQDITSQVKNELALKESEVKFNKLFQFSPFSISLSEIPNGKFIDVNEHFSRTFGYERDEVIGRTSLDLHMIEPESRQKILSELQAQGAVKNVEAELCTRSGEKIPVLLSIEKISIGEKSYYLNAVIDIIERKKAEFKIAQKNSELEKMNKELQSFAYISSHDLQEPLRKIQTFATRILEKEYDNLSDLVKDNFNRMRVAARRMQTLIDDLLTYSRTSTEARKFEYADLQNIIEEVKEDLKEEIRSKQAIIETNVIPGRVFIIPFQFRQMMINLIGNSLKFSHPDRLPRITIKTEMVKGSQLDPGLPAPETIYCRISVSDNGIGFEPQYQNKIFEVFQRLHDKNTYEGTGVGLAIVKKIVDNHRGIIKAAGALNQGAVFDIYIPVNEPGRDS